MSKQVKCEAPSTAAKDERKGKAIAGAISVRPGVWLYQITDKGLALEMTAKGTKYYRDSSLNQEILLDPRIR